MCVYMVMCYYKNYKSKIFLYYFSYKDSSSQIKKNALGTTKTSGQETLLMNTDPSYTNVSYSKGLIRGS